MKRAMFHFDEELAQLLPRSRRSPDGTCLFSGPQSVKHLIESLGIPHTEILGISVNGNPAGLTYLVRQGDHVEVRGHGPCGETADQPRFVLDGHLGRLNASLRMLGFDCAYQADWADNELADVAVHQGRFLLTRDRRLLMRKVISSGYLVRNLDSSTQLDEVVSRFGLEKWIRPFRRCIRCNELLRPVEKRSVLDQLQPLTRLYFDEFSTCPSCGQVYWKGSHFKRMQRVIARFRGPGTEPELD